MCGNTMCVSTSNNNNTWLKLFQVLSGRGLPSNSIFSLCMKVKASGHLYPYPLFRRDHHVFRHTQLTTRQKLFQAQPIGVHSS